MAAPPYWWPPTWPPAGWTSKELGAVINYELTYDPEVHAPHRPHRSRGQQGLALSLYQPNEAQRVNFIEEYQKAPMPLWRSRRIGQRDQADRAADGDLPSTRPQEKVRAGDILGAAWTGEGGIAGADVTADPDRRAVLPTWRSRQGERPPSSDC